MADIKNLERKNVLQNSAKEMASSRIMRNEKMLEFYTKLKNVAFFNALLSLVISSWKAETKTLLEPAEQL